MSALSGINCFFSKSVCFPRLGVFFFFSRQLCLIVYVYSPAHTYLYFVYGFLLQNINIKKLAALQGGSMSCDPEAAARFPPPPKKPLENLKKPLKFILRVHVVKSPEKTGSK